MAANNAGQGVAGGAVFGRSGGDKSDIAGGATQGYWLNNQQYKEYLDLLKQRTQAQQVITRPVTLGQMAPAAIGNGGAGLAPYSVSVPGYGYVAPPAPAGKAGGYGGQVKPRAALPPRQIP